MKLRTVLGVCILVTICFGSWDALAQTQRYWIRFRDRGSNMSFKKTDHTALGITERALCRRAKVLPANELIDELDIPVDESYIDQVHSTGVMIRSISRWFNAVSAELTESQRESICRLSPVATLEPITVITRAASNQSELAQKRPESASYTCANGIDYGPSFAQLNAISVIDVHRQGITGSGVIIGMLDDGFNERTVHPALKNVKVIAEYDFVQRDSNTSRSPGEYATQGDHGEATLSQLAGYDNGKLIGVAYGASFILAKTEIDSVEISLEEDLYVEGLEWMERLGADIVSSSVGYSKWYTYKDFDGNTAITTKAARIAARKGVLLVTSMGNNGNYRSLATLATGTMGAPADADSIISVGAVDSAGQLATFSSTGPTYDGRVKPELVAPGVWVCAARNLGYYYGVGGTSSAAPLTAGVAALVLSAHPSLTPMQVRDRLMLSARPLTDTRFGADTHPNNFYGWGMVDATAAVALPSQVPLPNKFILHTNYPNPFNGSTMLILEAPDEQFAELAIYNALGQRVRMIYRGKLHGGNNYFRWEGFDDYGARLSSAVYFCTLRAGGIVLSQKLLYIK